VTPAPHRLARKRIDQVGKSCLESAEMRAEAGKAHFVSYPFHSSFIVFSCVCVCVGGGGDNRRMKHKISFKERSRTDETATEIYFCYSTERQKGDTNLSSDCADF
jgi:hypothetical protein